MRYKNRDANMALAWRLGVKQHDFSWDYPLILIKNDYNYNKWKILSILQDILFFFSLTNLLKMFIYEKQSHI